MNNCFYCEGFFKCREEMRILDATTSNEIPNYVLGIDQVCPIRSKTFPGIAKAMAEQWTEKEDSQ